MPDPTPSPEDLSQMDRWYGQYYDEVEEARRGGRLKNSTARTYLIHSENFVRWLHGRFRPGSRAEGQ